MNADGGTAETVDAATVRAVAALDDPSRRSIYSFVGTAGGPVTREDVANAVGISRKLAAFHLDKLVEVGVLVARVSTARAGGIRGRRPKVYQRSPADLTLSLPPRRPADLAGMLVEAIETADPEETPRGAAMRVAHQRGRELGATTRSRARGGRIGAERALSLGEQALRERGFEPEREAPTRLRLRNCPYRLAAADAPELVCHMNQRFMAGFLTGLGADKVEATLVPREGECCVELHA